MIQVTDTRQAKQIIQLYMDVNGLPYTGMTARTVPFTDLARGSCVFVTVSGWTPSPLLQGVEDTAKANGFRVHFKGGF